MARCLDRVLRDDAPWVGDPAKWRPGAFSGPAADALLAIRDEAGTTAYCEFHGGRALNAYPKQASLPPGVLIEVRHVTGSEADPAGARVLLAGAVDPALVGAVEVTDPQGRTVAADLRDGTFAVRLDDQPPLRSNPLDKGFRLSVFDHGHQLLRSITLG